jgi:hypothetical protein
MVAFVESDVFQAVDKWETTTPALGGLPDSPMNTPMARLVNRSRWLRNRTGIQGQWDASIEDSESLGNALRPEGYSDGRKYEVTVAGFPFGGKELKVGDIAEFYNNGTSVFIIQQSVGGGLTLPEIATWDTTPLFERLVTVGAEKGTLVVISPDESHLVPPTSGDPEDSAAVSFTTDTVTLHSGVQWAKFTVNNSSSLMASGVAIINADATNLDSVNSIFGIPPSGGFSEVAYVLNIGGDLGFFRIDPQGDYQGLTGLSITPGDTVYVGLDTTTGALLVQVNNGPVINSIDDVSLPPLTVAPSNMESFRVGAIAVYGAPPSAPETLVFNIGSQDGGRLPFSSPLPLTLPIDAEDGKRYRVTYLNSALGSSFRAGDVVEFTDGVSSLLNTRDTVAPLDIWDVAPTYVKPTPSPVSLGTVATIGAHSFELRFPEDSSDLYEVTAIIGPTQPIKVAEGIRWVRVKTNFHSDVSQVGFYVANEGATVSDILRTKNYGTLTGTCTFLFTAYPYSYQPEILECQLLEAGYSNEYRQVPIAGYINDGSDIYYGVNTDTGNIVAQLEGESTVSLTSSFASYGGVVRRAPISESSGHSSVIGIFERYSTSFPSVSAYLEFDLSPDTTEKPSFLCRVDAGLPVGAKDGKRYQIGTPGKYKGIPLDSKDVVEFNSELSNLIITPVHAPHLRPWNISETSRRTAVTPTNTYGTATITGEDPGPYTLIPTDSLNVLNWSIVESDGSIPTPSNTDITGYPYLCSSFVWPDLTQDSQLFKAAGFFLMSDGATMPDLIEYLDQGSTSKTFCAIALYVREYGWQCTTIATDGTLTQNDYIFSHPVVAGDKLLFFYNPSSGQVYLKRPGGNMNFVSNVPDTPVGQEYKAAFFASYGWDGNYPVPPLKRVEFQFSDSTDDWSGNTPLYRNVVDMPAGSAPGDHYEITVGGKVGDKILVPKDVVVILSDGKSVSVSPFTPNAGTLVEGDSILLLSNPGGSPGYATRMDVDNSIVVHGTDEHAHPVATGSTPGFMSAEDKQTLSSVGSASNGLRWNPTFTQGAALASTPVDSIAYSPSLNRIVACRKQLSYEYIMSYSDDLGATWTRVPQFAAYTDAPYFGKVFWSEPDKKFFYSMGALSPGLTACDYYTSVDGLSWTKFTNTGSFQGTLTTLSYSPKSGVRLYSGLPRTLGLPAQTFSTFSISNSNPYPVSVYNGGSNGFAASVYSEDLDMFVCIPYDEEFPVAYGSYGYSGWTAAATPVPAGKWTLAIWSRELGMFVAAGLDSGVMWSRDGKIWQRSTSLGIGVSVEELVWCAELGVLLAVTPTGTYWSVDGLSWSNATSDDGIVLDSNTFCGYGAIWIAEKSLLLAGNGSVLYRAEPRSLPIPARGYFRTEKAPRIVQVNTSYTFTEGCQYIDGLEFSQSNQPTIYLGNTYENPAPANRPYSISKKSGVLIGFDLGNGHTVEVRGDPFLSASGTLMRLSSNTWLMTYFSAVVNKVKIKTHTGGDLYLGQEADGVDYLVNLTGNVTSILVYSEATGPGAATKVSATIVQDSTPRTVTWPAIWKWENGIIPVMPTSPGAILYLEVFYLHGAGTPYLARAKTYS